MGRTSNQLLYLDFGDNIPLLGMLICCFRDITKDNCPKIKKYSNYFYVPPPLWGAIMTGLMYDFVHERVTCFGPLTTGLVLDLPIKRIKAMYFNIVYSPCHAQ